MARLFPLLCLFTVAFFGYVNQVDAGEYGEVTCAGTKKMPSLSLMGTFLKAKCTLPTTWTDEAVGKLTRCVFIYLKAWANNKFDNPKYFTAMNSIFPKKYHASMKTKFTACLNNHGKACKDEATDPTGKGWTPMLRCMEKWYNDDLCAK